MHPELMWAFQKNLAFPLLLADQQIIDVYPDTFSTDTRSGATPGWSLMVELPHYHDLYVTKHYSERLVMKFKKLYILCILCLFLRQICRQQDFL